MASILLFTGDMFRNYFRAKAAMDSQGDYALEHGYGQALIYAGLIGGAIVLEGICVLSLLWTIIISHLAANSAQAIEKQLGPHALTAEFQVRLLQLSVHGLVVSLHLIFIVQIANFFTS